MKKKQSWAEGDVFLIPIDDGRLNCVGQILTHERNTLSSAGCVFFDYRVSGSTELEAIEELTPAKVFASLLVTRELLDKGVWRVIGRRPVLIPREMFPYEHLRANGFIGATVEGSGIVNRFISAFYGLVPWDEWADPNLLDTLLIFPSKKPMGLIYKADKKQT